jgi:hypothetical protein
LNNLNLSTILLYIASFVSISFHARSLRETKRGAVIHHARRMPPSLRPQKFDVRFRQDTATTTNQASFSATLTERIHVIDALPPSDSRAPVTVPSRVNSSHTAPRLGATPLHHPNKRQSRPRPSQKATTRFRTALLSA